MLISAAMITTLVLMTLAMPVLDVLTSEYLVMITMHVLKILAIAILDVHILLSLAVVEIVGNNIFK